MADFKNHRRYEYLKRLSIEELEELLRTAPLMTDSQETSEYYDAIEEAILQHETEAPTGRLSDIDSAWAEFQQQYAVPEGRGQRLYPDEERSDMKQEGMTVRRSGIFRKAGLIAATIAAVLACMMAAQAAGLDVFGALAHWTDEAFHFESGENALEMPQAQSENETYCTIQAEVAQIGITIPVVPTWFPEGYELDYVDCSGNDSMKSVFSVFVNELGEQYAVAIEKYTDPAFIANGFIEKDTSVVERYINNGKMFYIMSNLNDHIAVWASDVYCIMIYGALSTDQLKSMIDSIGG